jgi:putative two-component system response regulator
MIRYQVPINLDFLRTLNALYVEDEEDVRVALSHFLQRRFARVDVAANGLEGLESFRESCHDVVITDVKMPVMDGLQMAEEIKTIRGNVPVIVITAYNDVDYLVKAIEIGIDSYVRKPVNTDRLMEAIARSTQVRQQQRELEKANQQFQDTLHHTIDALSRAIEKRDPYTDGHQKRVSQFAELIAQEMGLDPQVIVGIRLGGMIHDIGKISIPSELLNMPRRLTNLEFELIKLHPQAGADILAEVDFPWPIRQMVLQHHERLDGSGYPNGLKGEDILLEARIIAVADVLEAMANHRPYRPGLGIEAATAEIIAHRGEQYDPDVVDACLRVAARQEGVDILAKSGGARAFSL